MIVDTHYHFIPYSSGNKLPQTMIHKWVLTADCAGIKKSCEEVTPLYHEYIYDPDFGKLVRRMNERCIDITVV